MSFRAFLVARCSMIEDGADFTTAACMSAARFDDFTVEYLQGLACDEIHFGALRSKPGGDGLRAYRDQDCVLPSNTNAMKMKIQTLQNTRKQSVSSESPL